MPTYAVTFNASVCIAVKANNLEEAFAKVIALDSDDVLEIDPEPSIMPNRDGETFATRVA